jgi:hypothetical protein
MWPYPDYSQRARVELRGERLFIPMDPPCVQYRLNELSHPSAALEALQSNAAGDALDEGSYRYAGVSSARSQAFISINLRLLSAAATRTRGGSG